MLKLGFTHSLCRQTLKELSTTSLKASLSIWLAKESKVWSAPPVQEEIKSINCKLLNQENIKPLPRKRKLSSPVPSVQKQPALPNVFSFINKGSTCYANAILQVLAALPQLWDRPVAALNFPSPLISSFIKVMHQHSSAKSARDPSKFFVALENKVVRSEANAI